MDDTQNGALPALICLLFNHHENTEMNRIKNTVIWQKLGSALRGWITVYSGQELPNQKRIEFFDKDTIS